MDEIDPKQLEAIERLFREKAELEAKVERLGKRLEIDPRHPYDGIASRDETIKALEVEAQRQRKHMAFMEETMKETGALLDESVAKVERLEKGLESIAQGKHGNPCLAARRILEGE